MQRLGLSGIVLLSAWLSTSPVRAQAGAFEGEWRTSIGIVKLHQEGESVTGTFGKDGQFTIKGKVEKGNVLSFEYEEGKTKGDGRFTIDETGRAFAGGFQIRG